MRLKRCLSAIEFTTRRNHGKLSESVPSRSNIASLYLGMIRIPVPIPPPANLSVGLRSHPSSIGMTFQLGWDIGEVFPFRLPEPHIGFHVLESIELWRQKWDEDFYSGFWACLFQ